MRILHLLFPLLFFSSLLSVGETTCPGRLDIDLTEFADSGCNVVSSKFDGTISPTISAMKDLQMIQITYSDLHGTLPTELGLCTQLHTIVLQRNKLRGSIPSELGNMPYLFTLDLGANLDMDGVIPVELFKPNSTLMQL